MLSTGLIRKLARHVKGCTVEVHSCAYERKGRSQLNPSKIRPWKTRMVWLLDGEKFDNMFSHFDTIPACDGETERLLHLVTAKSELCISCGVRVPTDQLLSHYKWLLIASTLTFIFKGLERFLDVWSVSSWNIRSRGPIVSGTKVSGSKSSWKLEHSLPRNKSSIAAKVPRSECSTEQKFHRNESSLCGLFAPGNESAGERKVQITASWQCGYMF